MPGALQRRRALGRPGLCLPSAGSGARKALLCSLTLIWDESRVLAGDDWDAGRGRCCRAVGPSGVGQFEPTKQEFILLPNLLAML